MELDPINNPPIPEDFHLKLRTRFLKKFHESVGEQGKNSISLYKGIEEVPKNYDDINQVVEQESTFWYFFGVKETHCYAIIHHDTGKVALFVPELSEGYKLWMFVKSRTEFKEGYKMDEVLFTHQLRPYIEQTNPSCIYLYSGEDTDSKIRPDEPE